MTSLWSFLLQTLTVSAVAALLLVLKAIFRDKLSPRWQYGVWALLALRCLLPAGPAGQGLLPLERWVELAKTCVEAGLSSAYADLWTPVTVASPLPWLTAAPRSVTDWLFAVYAAGVVCWLLWFLIGYLRLRRTLTVLPEGDGQVERVAGRYGLPLPRVARAPVASAFVCGPLRPVLVLPEGGEVDDKVILHELLHLRYGDLWLNVLGCLLRCLHWCDPFLWWVFDRVGNDAEALCDQRVLERLEGEERRDYGRILLSMADDRYARLPGTTSMANGGRNIKARIQSIARFKRYPRGMALVSLCIVVILIPACLTGPAAAAAALPAVSDRDARAHLERDELEDALLRGLAAARVSRPSTVAGALDCYAKAVVNNNGYFLAAVTDTQGQRELYDTLLERNDETWEWGNFYLDLGLFPADDPGRDPTDQRWSSGAMPPYLVLNLTETESGYDAEVAFFYQQVDRESRPHLYLLTHRVEVARGEGGWLVEKTGEDGPAELSDLEAADFSFGVRYLAGHDLAQLSLPEQDGLRPTLHLQRISLFSDETLSYLPHDHGGMICAFGNNATPSPDLDARFASSLLYGCLEVRCPGASPGAEYHAGHEFNVYAGDERLYGSHNSGAVPLWPHETEGSIVAPRSGVGALETDGGVLADRIQFSFTLVEETADGERPVAQIPLHEVSLDLTEVIP